MQLTHEGSDAEPQWSADGTRLFFVRGGGASAEIYSIAADGSGVRRLTNDSVEQLSPRLAPRGGVIAYVQTAPGSTVAETDATEVWVAGEDGTGARRLSRGFDEAWSPDGSRLSYATNGVRTSASGGRGENAIRLVNAQGQNDWELLPLSAVPRDLDKTYGFPFRPGSQALRAPSWSADGQSLSASADGHTGLVLTMDEKGGDIKIWVMNYEGGVGRAIYAPRGRRLAVESRPASGISHVTVIDTATSSKFDLGSEKLNYSAAEPTWAPDSARLAVVTLAGGPGASGPKELLVFGTDGAAHSRAAAGNIRQPAWNPTR